eukprot:227874-Amorphochlora_amoeboformis.AAC.1
MLSAAAPTVEEILTLQHIVSPAEQLRPKLPLHTETDCRPQPTESKLYINPITSEQTPQPSHTDASTRQSSYFGLRSTQMPYAEKLGLIF